MRTPFSRQTDSGRKNMETIRGLIHIVNVTTKIEIEGKWCHGHSNHETKVNAVILIQIIKYVEAFFLKDMHFLSVATDRLYVLPATVFKKSRFMTRHIFHYRNRITWRSSDFVAENTPNEIIQIR
jgi:hypothetical protein